MDHKWTDEQKRAHNLETYKDEINAEQVKQLYTVAPFGIAATILNSVIIFFVLKNVMPQAILFIWLAAIVVISILRIALAVQFRRTEFQQATARAGGNRFMVGLTLSGIAWGSLGFFPFSGGVSLAHQVFIAFVLGGMAAGAATTFSVSKEGYLAYSIPALAPLAVRFFFVYDIFHLAMGAMLSLYGLLLWRISLRHYLANSISLLLRFENRGMIDELRSAKEEMEKLNNDLVTEIDAKRKIEAELRFHHDRLENLIEERTRELRQSEAHALEESATLEALIDAMPAAVLIVRDPKCSQMTCNPAGSEIIGAIKGQQFSMDAPDHEYTRLEIRRDGVPISIEQLPIRVACVTGQSVMGDEIEIIRSDGVTRQFYGNAVPLLNRDGTVRGAVGVLLDISELKQAQDKIANLAAIVDSSKDAIIGVTLEGTIVSWNPGAKMLYGYSDREAIGRAINILAPPDRLDEIPAIFERIRRGETIAAFDTSRMRKDGTLVDVSLRASPIKDSTGKIIGVSAIVRDITNRKKLEERIKRYSKRLQLSNKELDNFASIAAHDLSAPLRAVSGFAERLQKRYKGKLDAEVDQYVSHIVEGTRRMQHLINDLLEYARIGTREKPLVQVDVNAVIEKTLANLTLEIQESGAAITVDQLPTVSADSTQLVQLFQNIIENAIKYRSNTPHINISAERKNGEWLFQVSDNGIGIDPRQFDRIFEIFQRLHTREEYSGTGIGLAICKKIVERLGGRIWVESKPTEGSSFFFTLPVTESSHEPRLE